MTPRSTLAALGLALLLGVTPFALPAGAVGTAALPAPSESADDSAAGEAADAAAETEPAEATPPDEATPDATEAEPQDGDPVPTEPTETPADTREAPAEAPRSAQPIPNPFPAGRPGKDIVVLPPKPPSERARPTDRPTERPTDRPGDRPTGARPGEPPRDGLAPGAPATARPTPLARGDDAARRPLDIGAAAGRLPTLEALDRTRERPLFVPGRRGPETTRPVVEETPPTEEPVIETPPAALALVLRGVVAGPGVEIAILADPSSGDVKRLKAGEEHDGWHLSTIDRRRAVFRRGEEETVLEMAAPGVNATGAATTTPSEFVPRPAVLRKPPTRVRPPVRHGAPPQGQERRQH